MPIDTITAEQLLTVGGISIVTYLICALIFRTAAFSPEAKDRFGAAIATLIGITLAVIAVFVFTGIGEGRLLQGVLTGLVGGLSAVGINEVVSGGARAVNSTPTIETKTGEGL